MGRRSTKSKTKNPGSSIQCDEESVKPLLQDLFVGVCNDYGDPFRCIPFSRIRDPTKSGINKIISVYEGFKDESQTTNSPGIVMGTDANVSQLCYIRQYFVEKRMPEDKIQSSVNQFDKWFGIVDGDHSHEAVRCLISNKQNWKSYRWFVTVLEGALE